MDVELEILREVHLFLYCGGVGCLMISLPSGQHITYQLQYRKCGKTTCSTCRNGQGHGPYWYAYWREGSRLRSGYIGKVHPDEHLRNVSSAISASADTVSTVSAGTLDGVTPALV